MKKANLEVKVGLFVFIALAGLTWMVFRSGDFYVKPGYLVRFVFDSVSGVDRGSTVCLSGVPVGNVNLIGVVRDPAGNTKVEITARIDNGVQIEEDATIRISSIGLLGEKYLEITPGTSGGKLLSENSTLLGSKPTAFDGLAESGANLINKLDGIADDIRGITSDPEFQKQVKSTFANADSTFGSASTAAKNFSEMSEDLKEASKSARIVLERLRDGEGTIGRLLKNDKMAKDLEAFAAEIKAHPWKLLKRD